MSAAGGCWDTACKPHDDMAKQLLFVRSILGHPRPMGHLHLVDGHRHA